MHTLPAIFSATEFEPTESSKEVKIRTSGTDQVVSNFQAGHRLEYVVKFPSKGNYRIEILCSSMYEDSAFHLELADRKISPSVKVPNTGGWNSFDWVGVVVKATKGKNLLTIVADKEYFDLSDIRVKHSSGVAVEPPDPEPPLPTDPTTPDVDNREFYHTFENGVAPFGIQAKDPSRVTICNFGRENGKAVRLQTQPGDTNVFGSGNLERCDLSLNQGLSGGFEGNEWWYAHSVMFPIDYVSPATGIGLAMDFHHTGSSGQANLHLDTSRWDNKMRFRGYGGSQDQNIYEKVLETPRKNIWYDFVYHIRWSSNSDGFVKAWMNGKFMMDHRGPTLYKGMGCYWKLANYHSATGPSSIIHDRIIRGTTAASVALGPLEGVV